MSTRSGTLVGLSDHVKGIGVGDRRLNQPMGDELTQLCESDIAVPQPGARQRDERR